MTDFPSSVQCFVFILWRNVMIVMRIWVSSECLCKSSVFASLVFLLFTLEVMSSAFVLPFAAVLIVEAFVFVFCLHHETRRCVVYWFLFWSAAVSLRCCYWAVFERRALSFSSQVMCFDLERAVSVFVLNGIGCFDT